ncbi:hybrid sensor histidine kinase/response regulator [Paracoccus sp. J56]|uniref:hybrid sensor histidine kinase/response regulator n=1 Tax=Paracoccus sp. J56 TaxID=935850 RepID=UPI000A0E6E73|nr:PAS-domain containing protein [Paracoccus sp. J56]SMG47739.1 signal transduction histidine kinase [Paracoccus sp. J56]
MAGRISDWLIDRDDEAGHNLEKLLIIAEALMRHSEERRDENSAAFEEFRRAALLEERVRQRTRDLEATLERLNAANATAERARRDLSQAIEAIEEGFALFDPEDRLVLCNSRFCADLTEVHQALAPGISFATYVRHLGRSRQVLLPEGTTPDAWIAQRLQLHGQSQHFNIGLTGDRWIQVSEQRTSDGGTVVLHTDVTRIIRTERIEHGKLLDSQARMIRATLEHINQGVGIFDAYGALIGWNQRLADLLEIPAALMHRGLSFERLTVRTLYQARFNEGFSASQLRDWVRMRAPRPPLSFELWHASGVILDVHGREMPERGFVMSFTDVTRERLAIHSMLRAKATLEARVTARTEELAAALANAERANSARVRFVAAASHDLLQPLSAAKLFVASARDDAGDSALRGTLEKAHNALLSVEGILSALLDLSRLESGGTEIEIAPLSMKLLLAQLTDEFAPLAAAKGLRLRIMSCRLAVQSDATYLRRILQNLIGNAIRYTVSGRVLVGARRRGDHLRIEVHDTGPGIAPEHQQAIFREFHRVEGTASAAQGMGLGLAIVERACALLDHRLELHSVPGRGTLFSVELPVAHDLPSIDSQTSAPSPLPETGMGRIVLLVENDEDLRSAITQLLERRGVEVVEASSGSEALTLIEEMGVIPDIYLLDQQLGEGPSGVETAQALHRRFGSRPTRIITADRSPETRRAAGRAGLQILFKPIAPEALEAFVFQADDAPLAS